MRTSGKGIRHRLALVWARLTGKIVWWYDENYIDLIRHSDGSVMAYNRSWNAGEHWRSEEERLTGQLGMLYVMDGGNFGPYAEH